MKQGNKLLPNGNLKAERKRSEQNFQSQENTPRRGGKIHQHVYASVASTSLLLVNILNASFAAASLAAAFVEPVPVAIMSPPSLHVDVHSGAWCGPASVSSQLSCVCLLCF